MWSLKDAKTAHYYYVSYSLLMKHIFIEAAISSNMKDTKDTMNKASACLYIPSD